MSLTMQRVFAWSGSAYVLILFPAALMAGMIPPISPSLSAPEIAAFWSSHTDLKRVAVVIMIAAAGVQVPFGALIAVRVRQMEGRQTPLTYAAIVAIGLQVMSLLLPAMMFGAASFRPDRNPEITQAFNDIGWLFFVMNWQAAAIQAGTLGLAVLGQRREVFPRWNGYYNLWTAFLFAAGGFVVMFKTGVFAWNGLLAFWFVAVVFGGWFNLTSWMLFKTITPDDDGDEESATTVTADAKGSLAT